MCIMTKKHFCFECSQLLPLEGFDLLYSTCIKCQRAKCKIYNAKCIAKENNAVVKVFTHNELEEYLNTNLDYKLVCMPEVISMSASFDPKRKQKQIKLELIAIIREQHRNNERKD